MTRPADLNQASARDLAERIARREISAVELMRATLDRIREVNPRLNAIVTLAPAADLLRAAEEADRAVARGEALGPLHGLPIAVKDLHRTAGLKTTLGSPIFAEEVPDADDLIVERHRAAGAIVIGKTNTPEFGAGSQTFNAVFGITRNPWNRERTTGGSSGGSAAALASGMVPLADGSDFGGSLRNPASFCGVFGLRPTPGRVPVWPEEAPWFPIPVQGPMARTAADAALLLSAIAGPDPRDARSLETPGAIFRRPLECDFTGVRVAWAPGFAGLPFEPEVLDAIAPAREALTGLGCVVEDASPDMSGAAFVFDSWRAWWFETLLGPLLDRRRDAMKETVVWNIEQARQLGAPDLAAASRRWARLLDRTRRLFDRFAFLVLPTVQVPPFPVEVEWVREVAGVPMGSYTEWMGSCSFVSVLGAPAASVPFGLTRDRLPVGLQIVGRPRDDFGVLSLGGALERPRWPPEARSPRGTRN